MRRARSTGERVALGAILGFAAQVVIVLLLAGGITWLLRRPRLALDAALRGGTREGKLYVVVLNRGGFAARGTSVLVSWRRQDGERSRAERRELGILYPADPIRLEVTALQALVGDDASGWSEIVVEARATNAFPARSRIQVAQRDASASGGAASSASGPEPVRYVGARTPRCPDVPDGAHLFERRPYVNDGVTEHWHVCRRCRHVEREPLTPDEERVQRQRRRERLEAERRRIDAELDRARRAEEPRARPGGGGRTWRHIGDEEDGRARDVDTFPPEVAFFVLELDPRAAGWDDVVAAHRRLALAHHPDRRAGADAATRAALVRKMQEINAARDRLREHFGLRAPVDE